MVVSGLHFEVVVVQQVCWLGFDVEQGYVADVVVVVVAVVVDDDVDGVLDVVDVDGVVDGFVDVVDVEHHYFEGLEPVELVVELEVGVFLVDLDLVEVAFSEAEVFLGVLAAGKASFEAWEYHYLEELEFVGTVDQQLQPHSER